MTSLQQPIRFTIKDSVALVTGTNKPNGIGSHIVRMLLEHGATKVYATARDATQIDYLVHEFVDGQVVPVALDVTDIAAIQKLPLQCPDVTLVVNNAGYMSSHRTVEEVNTELQVNYVAPFVLVQAFTPILQAAASQGKATAGGQCGFRGEFRQFPRRSDLRGLQGGGPFAHPSPSSRFGPARHPRGRNLPRSH